MRCLSLLALVGGLFLGEVALGEDVLRHEIAFPDLPGSQTLVCDLHQHTVFSDGLVWPTVRVDEAVRTGLDAMALSDHIEYRPHKDDLSGNLNRSYELAVGSAHIHHLLFPHAIEITRDTPPGHFNALFLQDSEPLKHDDFVEQIKRANEQGAFVFWNHQDWQGKEKGRWLEVHEQLLANHWFQGMEVANGSDYYADAHQACLDKNLTMLGNSDIHEPDLRPKSEPNDHRSLTLVFAKERTLEGLKEALLARQTAVWYKDQIIARQELLEPFFQGCLTVAAPHYRGKDLLVVELANHSDVDLKFQRTGSLGPETFQVPARTNVLLKIKTATTQQALTLEYTVTNFLIAPGKGLPVKLELVGP